MIIKIGHSLETDYRLDFKSYFESDPELFNKNNYYAYYSSRLALLRCLIENFGEIPLNRLEIENHHHLKHFKHLLCSLSHTQYDVGEYISAACLSHKNEFQSVGIDIEKIDRPIKTGVLERISHPDDYSCKAIESWVRKEAAFKALSPLLESGPVSKEIKIAQDYFEFSHYSGVFEAHSLEHNGSEFLIAFAGLR